MKTIKLKCIYNLIAIRLKKFPENFNCKNFKKNSDGFISLFFLNFLGIIILLYFILTLTIAISNSKDKLRTECVQESYAFQKSILQSTRQLFNLNKVSTALRISINVTKAAIAVNLATMNLPAIPPLERTLQQLYQSQKNLDQIQKMIIKKIEIEIQLKPTLLTSKMYVHNYQNSKFLSSIIHFLFQIKILNTPQLPIQPDSGGGIGPNYEWKPQAEGLLTLSYIWKMHFMSRNQFQTFINTSNNISIKCGAKPNLGEKKWSIEIIADKQ